MTPDSFELLSNWLNQEKFSFYRPCLNEIFPTAYLLHQRFSNLEKISPPLEFEVLIEHTSTKTPIGFMSLSGIDYFNLKAEFSIGFVRGIGTRCVMEAIHFAFDQAFFKLNLRKLIFYVDTTNSSALRLLLKQPFFQEGILRQELLLKSGVTLDLCRYALLVTDWKKSRLYSRLQMIAPLSQ